MSPIIGNIMLTKKYDKFLLILFRSGIGSEDSAISSSDGSLVSPQSERSQSAT